MKRCPECRRDYYDDTLLYCLEDRNALVQGSVPSPDEPATHVRPPHRGLGAAFELVVGVSATVYGRGGILIQQGLSQSTRLKQLNAIAITQMKSLINNSNLKSLT